MNTSLEISQITDDLTVSLAKLNALLRMANHADVSELKSETFFHYFWIAEELLKKIQETWDNILRNI